ncbi:hypothetical protein SAY86_021515 [Trapa natans]|uniref:Uncharacterized protein n=1 Tax=Trapa natans TaxID=22666 RepID=A0AAN7M279_TRANT|nr:hypothetical protein SAY86_021515 [Trapa natans]
MDDVEEADNVVTMALQSDTLSCKLSSSCEVLKLIVGLALGTDGSGDSPTSICTTALIVGRKSESGLEQARPTSSTLSSRPPRTPPPASGPPPPAASLHGGASRPTPLDCWLLYRWRCCC